MLLQQISSISKYAKYPSEHPHLRCVTDRHFVFRNFELFAIENFTQQLNLSVELIHPGCVFCFFCKIILYIYILFPLFAETVTRWLAKCKSTTTIEHARPFAETACGLKVIMLLIMIIFCTALIVSLLKTSIYRQDSRVLI